MAPVMLRSTPLHKDDSALTTRATPLARAAHALCMGIAIAASAGAASSACAQGAASTVPSPRAYDIPAGPLGPVLSRFAGAAGVTLSFEPSLTEGLRSPGLQGSVPAVEEGFARLLVGSGLEAVPRSGGGGYTLRRGAATPAPAAAAGPLPTNDGYTLFDAMAAYDVGAWRMSLNVSNLADKRYRTQCNTVRGGAEFCALGFGREVRVAAAHRF